MYVLVHVGKYRIPSSTSGRYYATVDPTPKDVTVPGDPVTPEEASDYEERRSSALIASSSDSVSADRTELYSESEGASSASLALSRAVLGK